jgi:hypothetical protein
MSRHRLCRACGAFHRIDEAWPLACAGDAESRRSHLAAPSVRADGMTPTRCMADGKVYDSRSRYDASVRRAGCEIVGDDRAGFGRPRTPADLIPPNTGADVRRAIEELRSR